MKSNSPSQSTEDLLPECFQSIEKITSKFQILHRIGKGSFGDIYKAVHLLSSQEVAIKVEFNVSNLLSKEAKILLELESYPQFPRMFYFIKGTLHSYLVMSYLGANLEKLKTEHKSFSLKTILMLGYQMISRLEHLHSLNYVHRDIKPENFLIGVGKSKSNIFLIDFGLAKSLESSKKSEANGHKKKGLVGTARYASITAHLGEEQGPKDDLESLGYLLIYLRRGSLPWQDIPANTKEEKYRKIYDKKKEISLEGLCKDLPELINYFKYLKEVEKVDYSFLKRFFMDLVIKNEWKMDFEWDWEERKKDKSPKKNNVKLKLSSMMSTGKSLATSKKVVWESSEKIEEEEINLKINDGFIKEKVRNSNANFRYELAEINENSNFSSNEPEIEEEKCCLKGIKALESKQTQNNFRAFDK